MDIKFKRLDYVVKENLDKEQVKDLILPNLNELSNRSGKTIGYCGYVFNILQKKAYYIVDSDSKLRYNLPSEIIDIDNIEGFLENYFKKAEVLEKFYIKTQVYTKQESDNKFATKSALSTKANTFDIYTRQESDTRFAIKSVELTKADKTQVYTKQEIDQRFNDIPAAQETYTRSEIDSKLNLKLDKTGKAADSSRLEGSSKSDFVLKSELSGLVNSSNSNNTGDIDDFPDLFDKFIDCKDNNSISKTGNSVFILKNGDIFLFNSSSSLENLNQCFTIFTKDLIPRDSSLPDLGSGQVEVVLVDNSKIYICNKLNGRAFKFNDNNGSYSWSEISYIGDNKTEQFSSFFQIGNKYLYAYYDNKWYQYDDNSWTPSNGSWTSYIINPINLPAITIVCDSIGVNRLKNSIIKYKNNIYGCTYSGSSYSILDIKAVDIKRSEFIINFSFVETMKTIVNSSGSNFIEFEDVFALHNYSDIIFISNYKTHKTLLTYEVVDNKVNTSNILKVKGIFEYNDNFYTIVNNFYYRGKHYSTNTIARINKEFLKRYKIL